MEKQQVYETLADAVIMAPSNAEEERRPGPTISIHITSTKHPVELDGKPVDPTKWLDS